MNFCHPQKFNSREIYQTCPTAKFDFAEMKKFRGFWQPRNFLTAKVSDNKIHLPILFVINLSLVFILKNVKYFI